MIHRIPLSPRSLRARLILWNAVTLTAIFCALGIARLNGVRTSLFASIDRELMNRTDRIALNGAPPGPPRARIGGADNPFVPSRIANDGTMLTPRSRFLDEAAFRRVVSSQKLEFSTASMSIDGEIEPIRVLSRPFPENENGPAGVVQAPYPLRVAYDALAEGKRTLAALIPVALLCAGLGGWWLTERSLRSVKRIAQTAERIGGEDLSQRLDESGGDEFAQLAGTFNRMLGRLESAFDEQQRLLENQKRFTADASHELQTPLAVIKANTSLTLSSNPDREECLLALKDVDSAADSMTRLVKDLLLLARSDGGQLALDRVQVPVSELLERAVARVSRSGFAPIRVAAGEEDLRIEANEDEVIRLFANLLENAQRYTPPNGEITVTVREEGGSVVVAVSDTGAGIAPEHLPHLGERFYRVDAGRARTHGGSGLGLSICRSIAEAHGGSLAIRSAVGDGTTVIVSFPSLASPVREPAFAGASA